jgi:hypothetical protein
VISFANIESGWEQMIKVDFPFSIVLVGLSFRSDRPLLWFGVLGSLWWFFLAWFFWFALREYSLLETQKADKIEPRS